MLTSIDYFAGKLYSSPFEEKRSTIGDIIYSFTFLAIGAITFSATNIPAIAAMGAITAPAKAANPIPSVAPGKIAIVAAARPTPITAPAGVVIPEPTQTFYHSFQ
ncbi:hypothetical protein [Wolbachia endosymbiont of Armadillidium vulgare]|uniref:hypothetical protein n=1 Tax=Wolbachia endosymbiont of Armadillidium vulgare TaxID=77039 RepID=UPI00064A9377|nr:hypothetical protein [Wolbachia endosymbiont of Armadillidium vulgare]